MEDRSHGAAPSSSLSDTPRIATMRYLSNASLPTGGVRFKAFPRLHLPITRIVAEKPEDLAALSQKSYKSPDFAKSS